MSPGHRQTGKVRLRWLAIACTAALAVPASYLWWVLLSPFGYQPPADYVPEAGPGAQQVFVYGTLRNPLVRWLVLGHSVTTEEVVLPNYRRQGLDIVPEPTAGQRGELLTVQPSGLRRLDRYERLGTRYQRVAAELEDGRRVWVYRRLPQQESTAP